MEQIKTLRIHVEHDATHGMFIHLPDPDMKEFPELKEVAVFKKGKCISIT